MSDYHMYAAGCVLFLEVNALDNATTNALCAAIRRAVEPDGALTDIPAETPTSDYSM